MGLLNRSLEKPLREFFDGLPSPVTILVFGRNDGAGVPCPACEEAQQLVRELASVSGGKVVAEDRDVDRDAADARIYGIDKVPAVVVLGDESGRRDFGVRFFGVPSGYEFATLIEDIRLASTGKTDLSASTIETLTHLASPLHIQVFVTPTCPYCPRAVLLAHKVAIVSDLVTAEAIDATEFPQLADRYRVFGVPRTVVNDIVSVEGAVPEAALMAQLVPVIAAA
jgi:glutaredoxin-like protein